MSGKKKEKVLNIIQKRIDKIPLLPAVICELLTLDSTSKTYFDDMSELAKCSPPLAAKVLQIANSVEIMPINPITDVHSALIRIGVERTLLLVTMSSVTSVFTPTTLAQKNLWKHAIETAYLAEFIAEHCLDFRVDKSLAYICALLHDIGRLVLFEISAKSIDIIDSKDWTSSEELPAVESKFLGINHAEVGEIIGQTWNLPQTIVNVIKYHHDSDIWSDINISQDDKQLIVIVQLADFISVFMMKNSDWKPQHLERELRERFIDKSWGNMKLPLNDIIDFLPVLDEKCKLDLKKLRLL